LEANVTAAVNANNLPSTVAPVFSEIDSSAIIVPLKTEVVPRVAEVPTCQKMFEAFALPLKTIWRPDVVFNVDAICMMKTAFASPLASKVRSPDDISSEPLDL
jgi:hypothetical protein